MQHLNPAQNSLVCLDATLTIIHGAHDNVVPSSQSELLGAAAIPHERVKIHVLASLEHIEFKQTPEATALNPVVDNLLEHRDTRPRKERACQ